MSTELPPPAIPFADLLHHLLGMVRHDDELPDPGSAIGRATRAFFANSWRNARPQLARSALLRVEPRPPDAPHVFGFELDRPYRRKRSPDAPVELAPGPIRGTIFYRTDLLLADPDEPCVAVTVDRECDLFHPNHSRRHGLLCLGAIPGGPFELEPLLLQLYQILSYQNLSTVDPADAEAARWFATAPNALSGLEPVEPLW